MEKAKGAAQLKGRRGSAKLPRPPQLGISRMQSSRWQRSASVPEQRSATPPLAWRPPAKKVKGRAGNIDQNEAEGRLTHPSIVAPLAKTAPQTTAARHGLCMGIPHEQLPPFSR